MASEDKRLLESFYIKFLSTDSSWVNSIYIKAIGGTVAGALLVSIPLFYSEIESVEQLSAMQLCLIFLVMEACILLTVTLGDKFVDEIAKALDNVHL
ncbi:MAG: hypothetical protein AAF821_01445 [Cyanobacteria bacterium P01_D01_bin.156]